jgi:site-specific DNA-methyltransferase (adenine-specific)
VIDGFQSTYFFESDVYPSITVTSLFEALFAITSQLIYIIEDIRPELLVGAIIYVGTLFDISPFRMKKKAKITKPLKPYYQRSGFVLYLDDYSNILPKLKGESVDLIFADPPYFINKRCWDKSRGVEEDFNFHLRWISECRRLLKPHGTIWITGTHHSIHQCGLALQKLEFKIINDICWYKPNATPDRSRRCFAASHEMLLWAKKSKDATHVFNYDLLKHNHWPGDFFKKPNKQMRSIWSFDPTEDFWPICSPRLSEKRQGKHPTQKPLALLRRIILAATRPGSLILDPFAGSSTTGIAAYQLGQAFIGIEKEQEYLDLSIRRFEALPAQSEEQSESVTQMDSETIKPTKKEQL